MLLSGTSHGSLAWLLPLRSPRGCHRAIEGCDRLDAAAAACHASSSDTSHCILRRSRPALQHELYSPQNRAWPSDTARRRFGKEGPFRSPHREDERRPRKSSVGPLGREHEKIGALFVVRRPGASHNTDEERCSVPSWAVDRVKVKRELASRRHRTALPQQQTAAATPLCRNEICLTLGYDRHYRWTSIRCRPTSWTRRSLVMMPLPSHAALRARRPRPSSLHGQDCCMRREASKLR